MVDHENVLDVRGALVRYLDEIEASGFECYDHRKSFAPICRCFKNDLLINCEGNQGEAGSNLTPCMRRCKPFVIADFEGGGKA